jgi:hypothetical protein
MSAALPKSVESDYVASSQAATRADARFSGGRCAVVPISLGTVRIASRSEIESLPGWRSAFAGERKDRRYYELAEDTLEGFAFGYLLVEAGELRAVQPYFVVDQDLVTGAEGSIQRIVGWLRRFWPRFLYARTLMVGCAAGEGHLDGDDQPSQSRIAETLAGSLNRIGRDLKCAMVVLKEFPAKYRAPLACLPRSGFARIPSMPMTTLGLEYKNFEAYLSANLSAATRGKIRRKLRDAERAKPAISMSVVHDATPFVEEIYPLYLDVYQRSPLKFEKLTKEFLSQIGDRMPDKVRFFLWRQDERIIAFGLCTILGESICHEYVGFDYAVAFELNLYYRVFHDIIEWAIANGYKRFYSGSLNYDPKWHLRQSLYPIDLYVRHTSGLVNILFRRLLPLLEPTRSEPILPNFANYRELWE